MASVRPRENTFKIDLTNFPKRPTFEEIHKFVHEKLGLTVDHVVRLQMNHAQNCVHIKCRDLQTAQDVVEKHHEKHDIEVNKTKVKVRLVMDDGGVEVKLHDLSENVRNEEIVAFMKQYGDVIAIRDQIWGDNFPLKGVPTGVRIVKIVLRRHIKSFVAIQSEQTLVTYRNQPHTCKYCTNPSHPGSTCVENRKLLGQKSDLNDRLKAAAKSNSSQPASFASVLNNSSSSLLPNFVSLNETASSSQNSVAQQQVTINQSTVSAHPASVVSAQPAIVVSAPISNGSIVPVKPAETEEQSKASVEQNNGGASTGSEAVTAKQLSSDQSTHQAATAFKNAATASSISVFKSPSDLPNPITMEISDSDSNESSQENGPFQTVKRGKRSRLSKTQ